MKDFKIDGRLQRVFVLRETDERVIYMPVRSLHRVDYERMVDLENKNKSSKDDLLTIMADTRLDNGMNALVVYKNVIQVMEKGENGNSRILRANERNNAIQENTEPKVVERVIERVIVKEVPVKEEPAPAKTRRKPGPKSKAEKEAEAAAAAAEAAKTQDSE